MSPRTPNAQQLEEIHEALGVVLTKVSNIRDKISRDANGIVLLDNLGLSGTQRVALNNLIELRKLNATSARSLLSAFDGQFRAMEIQKGKGGNLQDLWKV